MVLLIGVFVGLGWLRAAVEKMIDPAWWSGEALSGFLDLQTGHALLWYQPFLDNVVEPNLILIGIAVVVGQLFAGASLISGWRLSAGLAVGVFLNLNFVAAGAVSPSGFYLICQTALLLWVQHERGVRRRSLRLLSTASFAVALLNLPFISTLDPAGVIEDPAIMLVTLGLLVAVASRMGLHATENRSGDVPLEGALTTRRIARR